MPPQDLTPSQHAAVEFFEGPLLVLAGPGSGKTRVITRRIARLVDRGVSPREILAITFTNKAAREMAERVQRLLPGTRVWVSTFHRLCARLLREYGAEVGLQSNFSIFDTSDQHQLIKQTLHDLDIDAAHFPPAKIGHQISQAKNELISAADYARGFEERVGHHLQAVVARVYPQYQKRLLAANAVDFDDLLLHVANLLAENEELRSHLDQRFRFILVDEYQDTNRAQYQIVASLSRIEKNLCATGDPDQSIYGWRGARIENILRFERDFANVEVIRLEDNFRSTPEILATADRLIAHNRHRKPKVLRTPNASGEPVELRLYDDGRAEADAIAQEIRSLVQSGQRRWSDFAIFYRVNALSRVVETALARQRIPTQMAGGVAFYERAEVKDLIAYLRLIENPRDRIAFLRVVNTPARGIGKTTVNRLARWADLQDLPLLDAARNPRECPGLSKRAVLALQRFGELMHELVDRSSGPVAELLRQVLTRTGYTTAWQDSPSEDDTQRLANVDELVSAARQYDEQPDVEHSLSGFLETASLAQDVDQLADDRGTVTLMTLHSAKGLEFPVVYLLAVEQNLLPHERSLRENDARQVEEERRLLFVGITRAEEKLVLTHTVRRELHGRSLSTIPSDFLPELDVVSRDCTGGQFESFEDRLAAPRSPFPKASSPIERLTQSLQKAGGRPLLTTGAALAGEADAETEVNLPLGFATGMRVRHPRYGIGIVVETGGYSRHRTVTVEFVDDQRRESFILSKCPLQPVG
ncbi:MAG: UvrD-helicase domain-containing protein [Planctomycetaceae bacterium]|nr:UvrD-helicase domain-containing protein [Planctomycetaceae bacterium]